MHEYTQDSSVINKGDFKRKKIVFSERNSTYECVNDTGENVCMLQIDGGVIPSTSLRIRCDNGFEIDGRLGNRTCLVELKGCDVKHACEQLYETPLYFEDHYPVEKFFCRIVSSGNKKPNIESQAEKKLSRHLKEKYQTKLDSKTKKNSEKLSDLC